MYQICVSGAAKGASVEEGKELAAKLGEAIAKAGHSLLTGATIGLPNYAAEAYKAAGGKMSVGISPAASKVEHVLKYHLPTEAYDTILYTGMHYVAGDCGNVPNSHRPHRIILRTPCGCPLHHRLQRLATLGSPRAGHSDGLDPWHPGLSA